ncbi:hypothetical protein JOB18_034390 [Solea senegalensis]|uniref:Uncharacterized protein n=1 Tax=Solea senegalensis TaxID=28829 RepID=A0AAV6RNE4_SOLSE|nr:hypothetical protein JOB18_034390 [Solea senegalensis]
MEEELTYVEKLMEAQEPRVVETSESPPAGLTLLCYKEIYVKNLPINLRETDFQQTTTKSWQQIKDVSTIVESFAQSYLTGSDMSD